MASKAKPAHTKMNSMIPRPPMYTPGSGLASKPPPPSKGYTSKLQSFAGSRLNSSIASTNSSADHGVKFNKENVTVTVRFRPLNAREIQKGEEAIWYASDDTTVASEYNPLSTYSYDKVFGPATTTRGVYDVAAQHVVSGAMQGINGTVFAYGVTSSGKTHTMHGEQKSPGIIPLAVKDIFNIIQETPGREFLLRVSYLEIYNEVINDLLAPLSQNLRIREDNNGTYVEGIKEEVVCTAAHALSLIASGEAHRHVGSNNLNLTSSRSHTIFTLTIESSARDEGVYDEQVNLSQLHLIDLAGSESSKAETYGIRKKEGSYINKSLLTLGTVISKLTDGKSTHVPYRDSKLTRLLQSSLSGHGRVSLICTVTPSSSSNEETHNTLKFAQRAKYVELRSSTNKILDEKSQIKMYLKEISNLREELEQVNKANRNNNDLKQLEADHVKLQSRLEEEEQEKAILVVRLEKLKKLILVSTKSNANAHDSVPAHRRRYSFGEEELSYLPDKKRGLVLEEDEDDIDAEPDTPPDKSSDTSSNTEFPGQKEKKSKKRGVLGWFKQKKHDHHMFPPTSSEVGVYSPNGHVDDNSPIKRRTHRSDQLSSYVGELFDDGRKPPPTGTTITDERDLLHETSRILDEEIASLSSSSKRVSKQAASSPNDAKLQVEITRIKKEIESKKHQMEDVQSRLRGGLSNKSVAPFQLSQQVAMLRDQLNDKELELEVKNADNCILQQELQSKEETIESLKKQLEDRNGLAVKNYKKALSSIDESNVLLDTDEGGNWLNESDLSRDLKLFEGRADTNGLVSQGFTPKIIIKDFQSQMLAQANELEKVQQENTRLKEEKSELEVKYEKSTNATAHAQQLASRAGEEIKELLSELRMFSEENQKLRNVLEQVKDDLVVQELRSTLDKLREDLTEATCKVTELECSLEVKEQYEADLNKEIVKCKQRERNLESELAEMWVRLAEAKKEEEINVLEAVNDKVNEKGSGDVDESLHQDAENCNAESEMQDLKDSLEEMKTVVASEKRKVESLELEIAHSKGEKLDDLELSSLSALQDLHVEALTKLQLARTKAQERMEKQKMEKQRMERERRRSQEEKLNLKSQPDSLTSIGVQHLLLEEERNGNICKICYEAPTAAVLLPCRHFCLCKPCATACKECPICRSEITNKIITFTS